MSTVCCNTYVCSSELHVFFMTVGVIHHYFVAVGVACYCFVMVPVIVLWLFQLMFCRMSLLSYALVHCSDDSIHPILQERMTLKRNILLERNGSTVKENAVNKKPSGSKVSKHDFLRCLNTCTPIWSGHRAGHRHGLVLSLLVNQGNLRHPFTEKIMSRINRKIT